jgi:SAM-dependent methyltransferase
MHPNYEYLVSLAQKINANNESFRMLDYGCGAGEVVFAARKNGIEAYGADVFYEGATYRDQISTDAMGTVVREINSGILDFPDNYFDLVVCNQVFEHVEALEPVIAELWRVLKPNGQLTALFPTAETIREGHIGIPFAHWFAKGSRFRYYWTLLFRSLGFGLFKEKKSIPQWTADSLKWIDQFTYYRPCKRIDKALVHAGFNVNHVEDEFVDFRICLHSKLRAFQCCMQLSLVKAMARVLFSRLGGQVLMARKIADRTLPLANAA